MDEQSNRWAVERFVAGLVEWDTEGIASLYEPQFVIEWPQSGERVRGVASLRAVMDRPDGAPAVEDVRISGSGELWVVEGITRYGADPYRWVAILEVHDGRIVRVREYWGAPFPAPQWRAPFVERME